LDSAGKPFAQLTQTLDVNCSGACMGGIQSSLALGDVIGIQYKHQKARCKVVWVGPAGTPKQGQIAVECLEKDRIPWAPEVPEDRTVDEFDPRRARKSEARWHQRVTCHGGAEVRVPGQPGMSWAVLTDLSMRGCYLHTNTPLPSGAHPQLTLKAEGAEIVAHAVVRTSNRTLGMGLEFVDLTSATKQRLHDLIQKLLAASGTAGESPRHEEKGAARDHREWKD
jgi:Tfp pilus assembly protein PilZ